MQRIAVYTQQAFEELEQLVLKPKRKPRSSGKTLSKAAPRKTKGR
jgi:hypothetical protein